MSQFSGYDQTGSESNLINGFKNSEERETEVESARRDHYARAYRHMKLAENREIA